MHPLFVPVIIFMFCYVLLCVKWPNKVNKMQIPAILLLVVVMLVYVYRMVYLFPSYPPMEVNENSVLHNLLF